MSECRSGEEWPEPIELDNPGGLRDAFGRDLGDPVDEHSLELHVEAERLLGDDEVTQDSYAAALRSAERTVEVTAADDPLARRLERADKLTTVTLARLREAGVLSPSPQEFASEFERARRDYDVDY